MSIGAHEYRGTYVVYRIPYMWLCTVASVFHGGGTAAAAACV